jgi:hypothetical protein
MFGNVMAKKELKTEVKRLRLTELEAKQLEKYLDDHDLKFSEFVNALIGQKVMSESPTVSAEPLDVSIEPKKKREQIKKPPKADPALLFQIGRIGNNLNQLAKSLNILRQDSNAISNFSFLECFHALSQMQNDLHHWLGQLPKIERSPEAVSRARERALKKRRAVLLEHACCPASSFFDQITHRARLEAPTGFFGDQPLILVVQFDDNADIAPVVVAIAVEVVEVCLDCVFRASRPPAVTLGNFERGSVVVEQFAGAIQTEYPVMLPALKCAVNPLNLAVAIALFPRWPTVIIAYDLEDQFPTVGIHTLFFPFVAPLIIERELLRVRIAGFELGNLQSMLGPVALCSLHFVFLPYTISE